MKKVYLIAVVFALIAGFATYMFAQYIDGKTTIKDKETVNVIVAVQDIPENTEITEEMFAEDAGWFKTQTVIVDDVMPNYITSKEDIIGKVVNQAIYAGEQVSSMRYVDADSDDVGLSFKLSPGMVAYSFSAGSVSGVDGYISVGDTVDILVYDATEKGKENSNAAKVAYQDLKIIRVSNATDSISASQSGSTITSYGTLTVEVTKEQALKLYDIENNYSFKLVLNPREQVKVK